MSPQKKLLYYSSRLKGTHEDEVFVYDCRTKETRQLTDWCDVLNYMFIKEDKLYLAAIGYEKNRSFASYWCDRETGKPTDLTWDHDYFFVDYVTYNPLTKGLYCNLYSEQMNHVKGLMNLKMGSDEKILSNQTGWIFQTDHRREKEDHRFSCRQTAERCST